MEDAATFADDAPQSNARSADAAALETSGISFAAGPAVPAGTMFDSRLSPAPPGASARAAGALQGIGVRETAGPGRAGSEGTPAGAPAAPAAPAPAGRHAGAPGSAPAGDPVPAGSGATPGRAAALRFAGTAWGYVESTVDDGRDTASEAGSDVLAGGANGLVLRTARRIKGAG
ncbi:hypothetical protein HMPREF9404_3982, partial [Eggerthella sp. HGA1]